MTIKGIFISCILIVLMSFTLHAQENKTIYIFGHSLIVHDPPTIPTPSNETTVPHWLHFLAQSQSNTVAISGQYGFLPQHDNLPPFSQWGFEHVIPAWDSDTETFSEANFDTTIITAGNFIQDQASNMPYYTDPDTTPVSATVSIIDYVINENAEMVTYIYENWPDMAGFLSNGFPASNSEFIAYSDYTENEFHDWWLEYQDFLVAERPNEIIKMIPIGPIISKLLRQAPFNQIPITDLYEDDAPHGRPTIYFLAAMITYTAMFQNPVPDNFIPPNTINATVAANYDYISNFIWSELLGFNFGSGNSRVFINSPLNKDDYVFKQLKLYPNPSKNRIQFNIEIGDYSIECFDVLGKKVEIDLTEVNNSIDISNLEAGVWFFKISNGVSTVTKRIVKI